MSRLTRDGTAEQQILRRERGQGNVLFPCSADHEQDWQPYPVDPYSCYMCDHTYIHTYTPEREISCKFGTIFSSILVHVLLPFVTHITGE